MFSRFLKRRPASPAPAAPLAPSVPQGTVVWAIGDIHGRKDLLMPLISTILADLEAAPEERKVVIFLGDYIDRGPDSRGVIRFLAELPTEGGIEWRFLMGNHEETMLNFLSDPSVGARWCEYGGDATLESYGLRVPSIKHKLEAWAHVSAELDHKLTEVERAFLKNQELSVIVGDYFFAHAGARPGEDLDRQSAEDLMWIRRSFLDSDVEFDRIVVHGHTPTAEVHADRRRVGIDTKAYESGVLTALRLQGQTRSILQASGPDSSASRSETRPDEEVSIRTFELPSARQLPTLSQSPPMASRAL